MDAFALLDQLGPKNVQPVYLLHGPERSVIDRVVARLKELVLTGPMAGFNYTTLKAAETSAAAITALCMEIPMLGSRRLIVVDDGHKLGAAELEELDAYFAKPLPETCLVIIAERFDLRRGPLQRASKRGQVFKADPLKEQGIGPFLRAAAAARLATLDRDAEAALAAAVGPDVTALEDAVERLLLYAGKGAAITAEHVAEVVTPVRQHSIFELVDAVGNRDASRALLLLVGLLAAREEPLRINAMIARHVRQLLAVRVELARGASMDEIAQRAGLAPFVARKLVPQAKRFRGAVLERALVRLAETDFALKSVKRPAECVVEECVLDLCLG